MQNLVKKQGLWSPITVLTSLFKAPAKKEINQEAMLAAEQEYESLKDIGPHPHLDSERLMGMGAIVENNIINVTEIAVGDLLAAKNLTFPEILNLAKQVAEGGAHIHSKGYCHMDIKPENILLYKKNGAYYAKITDFGHTGKKEQ